MLFCSTLLRPYWIIKTYQWPFSVFAVTYILNCWYLFRTSWSAISFALSKKTSSLDPYIDIHYVNILLGLNMLICLERRLVMKDVLCDNQVMQQLTEAYSEHLRQSVQWKQLMTESHELFSQTSILDVWQGSECASGLPSKTFCF